MIAATLYCASNSSNGDGCPLRGPRRDHHAAACCAISASQRGQLPDPQRPGGQHPAAHVAAGGIREPHWHPSAWELNTVEWGSVFGAGHEGTTGTTDCGGFGRETSPARS